MRVELHPAYILHRRPYRESSMLLEVFSSLHGRVGLVARGARGKGARWRGLLEAFRPLLLAWSGRGELGTLAGAEPDGSAARLERRTLLSGFYLNELLLRLLHRDDPHPELFADYREALESLAAAEAEEPVLRIFEKRLLEALGYALVLSHAADEPQPIEADAHYYYEPQRGACRHAPKGQPTLRVKGRTLQALAAERLTDPETLREAKQLMRFVLAAHLGGRPLASRALFDGLPSRRW